MEFQACPAMDVSEGEDCIDDAEYNDLDAFDGTQNDVSFALEFLDQDHVEPESVLLGDVEQSMGLEHTDCTTPVRRLLLPESASVEKRPPPCKSSPTGAIGSVVANQANKRLRFKQRVECPAKVVDPPSDYIDGVCILDHKLFHKFKMANAMVRRTTCKRILQTKYRHLNNLKEKGICKIYGQTFECPNEVESASSMKALETCFFEGLAADKTKADLDRGFAMHQLSPSVRDNLQFQNDAGGVVPIVRGVPSVLLTYIGEHGILDIDTVDFSKLGAAGAIASDMSRAEKYKFLRSIPSSELTTCLEGHAKIDWYCTSFEKIAVDQCNKCHTTHWAFAVELCTNTLLKTDVLRVHGHLWVALNRRTVSLEEFKLDGYMPFINFKALSYLGGNSSRAGSAQYCGPFYCTIKKNGTIKQDSTIHPWVDFPVRDTWITSMFASGKITYATARESYINCVNRAPLLIQQLDYVQQERRKLELEKRRIAIEALLMGTMRPWKVVPAAKEWQEQFLELKCRYRFLVLDGPSCFGKTRYALGLNPPGKTYYCDCTGGVPLLKDFDSQIYSAILFDELEPTCAIQMKKALQASNEMVTLASSPTMQCAYTVHLHRVQLIICSNVWKVGLNKMKGQRADREWLEDNAVYVAVKENMWDDN